MSKSKIIKTILNFTWEPHDMPMTPHLVFSFLEAGIKKLKNILGNSYHYFIVYIKEEKGRFGFAEEDLLRLGKIICDKAKKERKFLRQIEKKWNRSKKEFVETIKDIDKINLLKLSNKQLLDLYNRFYLAYVSEYSIPAIANAVDFYAQKEIKNKLKLIVKDKNELVRYLTVINSPTKESFSNVERSNLLNIVSLIKGNKKLLDIFRKERPENINLQINNFPEIHRLIHGHAARYFWLLNNYAQTTVLDEVYFIKEIREIILTSGDFLKEIREIELSLKKIKNSKNQLIKKLKLDKDTCLLIKLQEASIYWRDGRKMYNQVADHYHMVFIKEVARRFSLSMKELMYTLPEEFGLFLKGGKINRNILRERRKSCLIISAPDKNYIISGPQADRINENLFKVKDSTGDILKGAIASMGNARGGVKIIMSLQDFKKMKQGDILVTSMTRPEFVPIMKLASAIVTDEGGVTCHAAIVSRELKIPCIIGTKIATVVLRDGDLVEVDANKGVVRKISKR